MFFLLLKNTEYDNRNGPPLQLPDANSYYFGGISVLPGACLLQKTFTDFVNYY